LSNGNLNFLKIKLLKYYHGTRCVCGKPKLPRFWECFLCYLITNEWPQKQDVREKCKAHTLAVKKYLDDLKEDNKKKRR